MHLWLLSFVVDVSVTRKREYFFLNVIIIEVRLFLIVLFSDIPFFIDEYKKYTRFPNSFQGFFLNNSDSMGSPSSCCLFHLDNKSERTNAK